MTAAHARSRKWAWRVLSVLLPAAALGGSVVRLGVEDHDSILSDVVLVVVLPVSLVLLGITWGTRRARQVATERGATFGAMATVFQRSLAMCPLVAQQMPRLHAKREYPRGARVFLDSTGLTVVGGPWARRRGVSGFALAWRDIVRIEIGDGPGVAGTAGLLLTLRDGSCLPLVIRQKKKLEAAMRQVPGLPELVPHA